MIKEYCMCNHLIYTNCLGWRELVGSCGLEPCYDHWKLWFLSKKCFAAEPVAPSYRSWPECWCCLSSSSQEVALLAWSWGWSGDRSKKHRLKSREKVRRKFSVSFSISSSQTLGSWKILAPAFALYSAILNSLFSLVEISQGNVGWIVHWAKIEIQLSSTVMGAKSPRAAWVWTCCSDHSH